MTLVLIAASIPAAAFATETSPAASATVTDADQSGPVQEAPAPTANAIQTRGDVRANKIANSKLVWGYASTGANGVIRGGTVGVKSLTGKTLRAQTLTKKTTKQGYFAVSRAGLPKRFIVQISGGKVARKAGAKVKLKSSNARLMAVAPKPKRGLRNTKIGITIGSTVAARVGLARWNNAGKARAVKLAKQALRLPAWAKLGKHDRLLSHYLSASTVHKKAKNGSRLSQLIDKITVKARKGKRHALLGAGERVKYRPHRSAQAQQAHQAQQAQRAQQRGAAGLSLEVVNGAIGMTGLFDDDSDAVTQIEAQLTEIQNTLSQVETQLTTMQDEMQAGFDTLSLQLSSDLFDTLSTDNNPTAADITAAMEQVESLVYLMQSVPNLDPQTCPSFCQQVLISSQADTARSMLQGFANTAVATTLQSNLIGKSTAPGLLPTLWNLIIEQRATPKPAAATAYSNAAGKHALASTELLTHENYDAFEPAAASWYLMQQQLAALTVNYQLGKYLGDNVWTMSKGQLSLSLTAQALQNQVMNGVCSAKPCRGSYNSYLRVLADSMPDRSVGISQALDTTTGTIWGNFGTSGWNSVASKPAASSPDLDMPPTTLATCNDGTKQTVALDQKFFATVNGAAGNCPWPGAPVGGPAGSEDAASNWQILSTDSATNTGTFEQTLGSLDGSGATGLYSQLSWGATNQNANPKLGIQGAHFLDFTHPSIFPATDWGRLSYAGGQWSQYMWPSSANPASCQDGLFACTTPEPARRPHSDFLAFDVENPRQPNLTANIWLGGGTTFGFGYTGDFGGNSTYYATTQASSGLWPSSGAGLSDRVAGLASPWWASANMSRDGDETSVGPPTPGCAAYTQDWDSSGWVVLQSRPTQGCTANIIGTRSVTVSDYTWNQPAAIG